MQEHTIGIKLGAGWWDHRPIVGKIVYTDWQTKGSITTIAQIHVVYQNGDTQIIAPTTNDANWKMGKGFLKDSSLFTGETMDLQLHSNNLHWDTNNHNNNNNNIGPVIEWVPPEIYRSTMTPGEWRRKLEWFVMTKEVQSGIPAAGPIGDLIPLEMPPVLPVDKIHPVGEPTHLGSGRWLYDFGKGMSGVVRFESGLPHPIKPVNGQYPRGHDLSMITNEANDEYITVIHGDSLDMITCDINLAIVAGFGHHTRGERHCKDKTFDAGPCFPEEDKKPCQVLIQRDVYLSPGGAAMDNNDLFRAARQPHFAVHGFQFAEVCCTESPPENVYAIQYRTAFQRWGAFSSSNVVLNGAYEMTQNSLESNMLGIQSDCPHRERLQYGGDIVAVSYAAMHQFDLASFYAKVVHDWTDAQFKNGAYPLTSTYMDVLTERSIGQKGSGETVWASVAPVLTVRHMQHYGDIKLVQRTLPNHESWLHFLDSHWKEGILRMYGDESVPHSKIDRSKGGLGDWYSITSADVWITHHAFYLASARAVAYLASIAGSSQQALRAKKTAIEIENIISSAYAGDTFSYMPHPNHQTAQDLGLFAKVMDGEKRCTTLRSWLRATASGGNVDWPGDEEQLFLKHLDSSDYETLKAGGHINYNADTQKSFSQYKQRYSINIGIFGLKYTLKTLSDMGFHHVALSKASGTEMPSFGMFMAFNSTTLWETWWRSEDVTSRNHPMFGAVMEWLASSTAGVSLSPTTVGGEELLFWPRIPNTVQSAKIVSYASASQGTKIGDAAVAWKFSQPTSVVIRIFVPPGSKAVLRLPLLPPSAADASWTIKVSTSLPDFNAAKDAASELCDTQRQKKEGFPFHWHYNPADEKWRKVNQGKALGSPCQSHLFMVRDDTIAWADYQRATITPVPSGNEIKLQPAFYEVTTDHWELKEEIPDLPGYGWDFQGDLGPFCSDPSSFDWQLDDAEHLI